MAGSGDEVCELSARQQRLLNAVADAYDPTVPEACLSADRKGRVDDSRGQACERLSSAQKRTEASRSGGQFLVLSVKCEAANQVVACSLNADDNPTGLDNHDGW